MPSSIASVDHPARPLSETERVDYLTAVASLVVADSHVDESELAVLSRLCKALEISGAAEERVISAAKSPDRTTVDRVLASVSKDPELRTSLLADAIVVVFADGKLMTEETSEIAEFARKLGLTQPQAIMISRHVEAAIKAERAANEERPASSRLSTELADGLTAEDKTRPRESAIRWLWRAIGKK